MARKPKLDKGVSLYTDRHGKQRARFRLKGMDFPLPHPSSSEYADAYKRVLAGLRPLAPREVPRSIGDLCTRFFSSARFERATPKWQSIVRQTLEEFRTEARDVPVTDFNHGHIERLLKRRSKKVDGKGGTAAALRLHEQLMRLFDYAVRLRWIDHNPAKEADLPFVHKVKGYHSWTDDEIAQFQSRHPLGTSARLAMELALWTALRRSDIAKLGPKNIRNGRLAAVAGKTGKTVDVMIAPDLQAAIDAMPEIGETFLQTQYGKPFSDAGLGNWFRDRANEAGLPQCSIHGLRKAFARSAADLGATQAQLKAVGQWANDAEVATYTAAANQRTLADEAIMRVIEGRTSSNPVKKVSQKSDKRLNKSLDMAGAGAKG